MPHGWVTFETQPIHMTHGTHTWLHNDLRFPLYFQDLYWTFLNSHGFPKSWTMDSRYNGGGYHIGLEAIYNILFFYSWAVGQISTLNYLQILFCTSQAKLAFPTPYLYQETLILSFTVMTKFALYSSLLQLMQQGTLVPENQSNDRFQVALWRFHRIWVFMYLVKVSRSHRHRGWKFAESPPRIVACIFQSSRFVFDQQILILWRILGTRSMNLWPSSAKLSASFLRSDFLPLLPWIAVINYHCRSI
jgi:hypothetical protein